LVGTLLGIAHNVFEKWNAANCRFSKEFCEKHGTVNALPVSKRVLQIQKLWMLSGE
jgi:hypothetical protein